MADGREPSVVPLGHYFGVLRRRWYVIVVCALVGLMAAATYLAITPGSFTASTDVNITVITTDPFNPQKAASDLLDGTTEAKIVQSYAVASRAESALNGELSTSDIRTGLEVDPVSNTTVIHIAFKASSQQLAVRAADAVAKAYLDHRSDMASQRQKILLDRINKGLDDLRDSLADANQRAAKALAGTIAAGQASSDRETFNAEISSLVTQKNTLELVDTSGGNVLSPAAQNHVAVAPRRWLVLLTGVVAGIALGALAAVSHPAPSRRLSRYRGQTASALGQSGFRRVVVRSKESHHGSNS